MKQKFLAMLLTVAMVCGASASAEHAQATEIATPDIETSTVTFIGENVAPRGTVRTFTLELNGGAGFIEVPDFAGEYTANTQIRAAGTWKPSYASVTLELRDDNYGGATGSSFKSGASRSFSLTRNSGYSLYVKSNYDLVGMLQLTITG